MELLRLARSRPRTAAGTLAFVLFLPVGVALAAAFAALALGIAIWWLGGEEPGAAIAGGCGSFNDGLRWSAD